MNDPSSVICVIILQSYCVIWTCTLEVPTNTISPTSVIFVIIRPHRKFIYRYTWGKHTGQKPLQCTKCDFSTAVSSHLKCHELTHTAERPFKCDECDYAAKSKQYLKSHKSTHTGERPYKCDLCDYASRRKWDLVEHKKVHSGEQPRYKCDLCDKTYTRRGGFKKHQRKHIDLKTSIKAKIEMEEKPLECTL